MSVAQGKNQLPSQADMFKKIIELEQELARVGAAGVGTTNTYKMKTPEGYHGERGRLQTFLTQARLYLKFHQNSLPTEQDKVLCVANLLEGSALEWFEPRMRDYLENPEKLWDDETARNFNSYIYFEDQLKKVFGEVDEKRQAERQLQQLKQVGSATSYTTTFRKIEAKMDWDEEALCAQYYRGLKDQLKDELARIERPDRLNDLIKTAVQLDNRLHERQLEKRGNQSWNAGRTSYRKGQAKWGDPMEIDAIRRWPKDRPRKQRPMPEKPTDWKKQLACYNCGNKGHFARECRKGSAAAIKTTKKQPKMVAKIVSELTEEQNLTNFEIPIEINGQKTVAMIDSGANMSFVSPEWVTKHGITTQQKATPYKVTGVDGQAVGSGKVTNEVRAATVLIGGHKEVMTLDVIPVAQHSVVLGLPWLWKHNPTIDWKEGKMRFQEKSCRNNHRSDYENLDPIEQQIRMAAKGNEPQGTRQPEEKSIPTEYQDLREVFEEPPDDQALPKHQPWDHEITLQEGRTPPYMPLYQLSEQEQKELREYIDINLKKGYIRPSSSPAGYPILFVPKKDGKLRLCVDYRKLNDITIKNRYPLPLINELRETTAKAQIFTKLDIRDAYYRIRIKEGDEWKTAFRTRFGHYEYQVMPFGLTNAPASFQALINDVLRPYLDRFVVAYLDDILVYSQSEKEHKEHVRTVLKALLKRELRVKLSKCEFSVQSTEFLGYLISPGEIRMDPKKVEGVVGWPTPKTVTEVQSFLGTANYYRRFIEGYSRIAAPLTMLTKKEQPYEWGAAQQNAFETIKQKLAEEPVLKMFDPEKPIVLETDASDYAIGACMMQPDKQGRMHPIMYHSRKMIAAEQNYDIHDKELLAIVDTFKEWRVYLQGTTHEVKVKTDHKNLTFFTTTKQLNRRQTRWAEELGQYNFRIEYTKGTENARADALSRREDHRNDGPKPGYQILKAEDTGLVYANQIATTYKVIEESDEGILAAYKDDPMAQELYKRMEKEPHIHTTADGYLRYHGKIYVPTTQQKRIIMKEHAATTCGHMGVERTRAKMKQWYYIPQMRQRIRRELEQCVECKKNKANRHLPYGEIQIPEAPTKPWEIITMDWINKLPPSEQPMTKIRYDSIWVVTCKLTKYARFIPYQEASTAEDLAYWFNKEIVANHGMPRAIISDRDKLITSRFWQTLTKQMGVQSKLSTAYHPQTNGQTERMNQTLEQYLRFYINYRQDNWVELLPTAQFAANSAISETTGLTPFYANYGFEPQVRHQTIPEAEEAQTALQRTEVIKEVHEQLRQDIVFIAYKVARYHDKNRLTAPTYRKGDKVFLQRANLRTTRPSRKLDHIKVGPFRIKEKISEVNYELELPTTMKMHPVFHVALLEPAPREAPVDRRTTVTDEEWEVEKILDARDKGAKGGGWHYLVKWKDYSNMENTWEPKQNLMKNCSDLVTEFHRQNPEVGVRKANPRQTNRRGLDQVHRILMVRKQKWKQLELRDVPSLGSTLVPSETFLNRDAPEDRVEEGGDPPLMTRPDEPLGQNPPYPEQPCGRRAPDEASREYQISDDQVSPLQPLLLGTEEEELMDWIEHELDTLLEGSDDPLWNQAVHGTEGYEQSLSDTTRSHLRLFEMQGAQRPEERSTRHEDSVCEDLQFEHGVGMTRPREERAARRLRRDEEGSVLRGMMSLGKRKRQDSEEGEAPLYLEGLGCRDEAYEGKGECYGPKTVLQQKKETTDRRAAKPQLRLETNLS